MSREADALRVIETVERMRTFVRNPSRSEFLGMLRYGTTLTAPECWGDRGPGEMVDELTESARLMFASSAILGPIIDQSRALPVVALPTVEQLGGSTGFVLFESPVDLFDGLDLDGLSEEERDDPQNRASAGFGWLIEDGPEVGGLPSRVVNLIPFVELRAWTEDHPRSEVRDTMSTVLDQWEAPLYPGTPDQITVNADPSISGREVDLLEEELGPGWLAPVRAQLRFFLSLIAFTEQVIEPEPTSVPRPRRRQAVRSGITGAASPVIVIDLPRMARSGSHDDSDEAGSGDGRGLDYASITRGHFRNQPIGPRDEGRRELRWIRPYTRGAGLPERPTVERLDERK